MTRETPVSTISHRGLTIKIYHDSDAGCPWDEWDCQPPMLAYDGRGLKAYGDGDALAGLPLTLLTDWQISRHWRGIAKALDLDLVEHDRDARARATAQRVWLADARRDLFGDALDDLRRYGPPPAFLMALDILLTMAGITTLRTTSRGYCQGDWADLLLAYTPAHAEACGGDLTPAKKRESLKADAKLWGHWAWGDVYGYVVEDETGAALESCWGFYGDSDDDHLIGEAKSAADYIADKRDNAAAVAFAVAAMEARPDMYAGAY